MFAVFGCVCVVVVFFACYYCRRLLCFCCFCSFLLLFVVFLLSLVVFAAVCCIFMVYLIIFVPRACSLSPSLSMTLVFCLLSLVSCPFRLLLPLVHVRYRSHHVCYTYELAPYPRINALAPFPCPLPSIQCHCASPCPCLLTLQTVLHSNIENRERIPSFLVP